MKFESTILGSDSGKKDLTDSASTVDNLKQIKPNRIVVRLLPSSVYDV